MITKKILIKQIENFPEEFLIDELIENLILIDEIENGLSQSENKEVISGDELENEIEKWFK